MMDDAISPPPAAGEEFSTGPEDYALTLRDPSPVPVGGGSPWRGQNASVT